MAEKKASAKEKDQEDALETVAVKAAQANRVGVWERDPAHPEGEVFVSGDEVVEVARTPLVEGKLRSGELVEASKSEAKAAEREAKEREDPAKAAERAKSERK